MGDIKEQALEDMNELARQERELTSNLERVRKEYEAAKLRKDETEERFSTEIQDIAILQKAASNAYTRACSGEFNIDYERLTISQGSSRFKKDHVKRDQVNSENDAGEQQSKRDAAKQAHRLSLQTSQNATRASLANGTTMSTGHGQKGFYNFIETFPTVVLSEDGVWVELRCPVCKGNTKRSKGTPGFFTGLKGLADHLWRAHGDEGRRLQRLSKYELLEACKHEIVDDETAQTYLRAKSDKIPNAIKKVACDHSVPCGEAPESPVEEAIEDVDMPDSSSPEPAPQNFRTPGFRSPQPARRTMPKHGENSGVLVRRRKRAVSDSSSDSSPPAAKTFSSMRHARGNAIRLSNPVEIPFEARGDSTVGGLAADKAIIRKGPNSD